MLLANLRSACRNLRAAPGFALTAILSLGIGIGGTLAMFTLVNSILLRPLTYPDPDRLVLITQTTPYVPLGGSGGLAPLMFLHWRDKIQSIESLAVVKGASVNLTGSGFPETLGAARISAEFFDTLGVRPLRGRWFRRLEEKRGTPGVVIISAALWRQRFAEDPHIIGKKIVLDGVPYEVVGITRPDLRLFRERQLHPVFDLPERTEVFLPVRFDVPEEQGRFNVEYLAIAA
jgi:hypothetical protein